MSVQFYNVLHVVAIFGLFLALGGATVHMMNGGQKNYPARRWVMITHGVALFFILFAGMGLAGKLGYTPFPNWLKVKIAVWLVLGGLVALIYRKPTWAKGLWFVMMALGAAAAWLAIFKPF